jgi:hypothetical protein
LVNVLVDTRELRALGYACEVESLKVNPASGNMDEMSASRKGELTAESLVFSNRRYVNRDVVTVDDTREKIHCNENARQE